MPQDELCISHSCCLSHFTLQHILISFHIFLLGWTLEVNIHVLLLQILDSTVTAMEHSLAGTGHANARTVEVYSLTSKTTCMQWFMLIVTICMFTMVVLLIRITWGTHGTEILLPRHRLPGFPADHECCWGFLYRFKLPWKCIRQTLPIKLCEYSLSFLFIAVLSCQFCSLYFCPVRYMFSPTEVKVTWPNC